MTFKSHIATESVEDLAGHSNRKLSTILNNPAHPMHAAAKSEFDRRKGRNMNEETHLNELTAAEKKLVNQMYDKKGNLTPMGKKVMNHGKKPGDKGFMEALERDGPKKPDGLEPSFGKAASASPAVQKYMAKRAAGNQARNKAMDPGAAKKGYGIGVTDVAKADKKAKAKGTSMMKRMGSRGKMYKAGKMM